MKENKKTLKRNERGITLIALVITIIVLLILAGVSIAMLTGDNGILSQATKAKDETEKAKIKEEMELSISDIQIEELSKGNKLTMENLTGYNGLLSSKLEISSWKDGTSGIYKEYYFVINDDFTVTIDDFNYDYSCVAKMKADYLSLSDGDIVTTRAYYENGNISGSGTYKITADDGSYVDDGGKYIKLDESSNLWAILQISNNSVDLYQYGAYGDGKTDDTNYIKSAFNSGVQIIHASEGNYLMSSGILLPSNISFIGSNSDNTTFIACEGYASGTEMFKVDNKENITLKNIGISGNSEVNVRGDDYNGTDGIHLLDLWGSRDINVENCNFKDNIYTAIRLFGGTNITVNNSTFTNVDCGVISLGSDGVQSLNITNNMFNGHEYSEPISLYTDSASYSDIIISGNTMANKIHGNGILFKSGNEFRNVTISNNTIENCATGINLTGLEDSEITNNNIKSTTSGSGVLLVNCNNVLVENLNLDNSYQNGLYLENCTNTNIMNVNINEFGFQNENFHGINLKGNGTGTKISGNITSADITSKAISCIFVNGNNYDISGLKFNTDKRIFFYDGTTGNIFHTTENVKIAYQAGNLNNDIIVNNSVEFDAGYDINKYEQRFYTKYIVNRKENTEYNLSSMYACQDGFKRTVVINAQNRDTKLVSGDGTKEGDIIWLKDRTISAGNSEEIYLICQDGIWHEVESF